MVGIRDSSGMKADGWMVSAVSVCDKDWDVDLYYEERTILV